MLSRPGVVLVDRDEERPDAIVHNLLVPRDIGREAHRRAQGDIPAVERVGVARRAGEGD